MVFKWNEDIQRELDTIKKIVTSPVYVKQFDPNKQTRLYTDVSNLYGSSYVLTQLTGEVNEKCDEVQNLIRCNAVVAKNGQNIVLLKLNCWLFTLLAWIVHISGRA